MKITNLLCKEVYVFLLYNTAILHGEAQPELNQKKLVSKQKQLLKIVNDKCDTFETMAKLKVLNVYMINLFQTLNFRITELLWCLEEE